MKKFFYCGAFVSCFVLNNLKNNRENNDPIIDDQSIFHWQKIFFDWIKEAQKNKIKINPWKINMKVLNLFGMNHGL